MKVWKVSHKEEFNLFLNQKDCFSWLMCKQINNKEYNEIIQSYKINQENQLSKYEFESWSVKLLNMQYVIEWQKINSLEKDPFEETNSYITNLAEDAMLIISNLLTQDGVYHVIVSQYGYD
jgi:hypothetical protein